VFAAADHDPVAAAIVERLADEVIAYATAAMRRLTLTSAQTDVVLGGGLIRAAPAPMIERIAVGVKEVAVDTRIVVAPSAPIVGAALLGFDQLGANSTVGVRARAELDAAFVRVEGDWAERWLAPRGDCGLGTQRLER
jgi:hypothetical protein